MQLSCRFLYFLLSIEYYFTSSHTVQHSLLPASEGAFVDGGAQRKCQWNFAVTTLIGAMASIKKKLFSMSASSHRYF